MPLMKRPVRVLEVLLDNVTGLVRRTQDRQRPAEFTLVERLLQRVELDEIVLRIRVIEG
jgi:hypothetical protein